MTLAWERVAIKIKTFGMNLLSIGLSQNTSNNFLIGVTGALLQAPVGLRLALVARKKFFSWI